MVTILMMSAKMTTTGLLKMKVFLYIYLYTHFLLFTTNTVFQNC